MHIVFHAGVHATDEDRLIKCCLKNTQAFSAMGVAVPGPSRYRRLIRDAVQALAEGDATPEARAVLLDAIIEGEMPERMILSNDSFFGVPKLAVGKGVFYPGAEVKLARLRALFPQDQIELVLALRNPATFLPAVVALAPDAELTRFLDGTDPRDLRWSELLGRITATVPDLQVTVWCNEDTPLLWGDLIRKMAGLKPNTKIIGGFDLLSKIMSPPGMRRFRAYLKTHPTLNEGQKRRVIAAFLDKYALDDAMEEEVDLPGWTDPLIHEMTALYEADLAAIQRMPGVTLITP